MIVIFLDTGHKVFFTYFRYFKASGNSKFRREFYTWKVDNKHSAIVLYYRHKPLKLRKGWTLTIQTGSIPVTGNHNLSRPYKNTPSYSTMWVSFLFAFLSSFIPTLRFKKVNNCPRLHVPLISGNAIFIFRRDERYLEDDMDSVPNPEVKKLHLLLSPICVMCSVPCVQCFVPCVTMTLPRVPCCIHLCCLPVSIFVVFLCTPLLFYSVHLSKIFAR